MIELTLPPPVLFVLHQLQSNGFEAYIVGGAVRDVMMQRSVNDWDFTTNAKPEEIQPLFAGSFYDNAYGTVMVPTEALLVQMTTKRWRVNHEIKKDSTWNKQVIDITTYRQEHGYSDRRRPDKVEWGKNIEDDLSRRDFTINAIAVRVGAAEVGYKPQQIPALNGLLTYAQRGEELAIPVELVDPYDGKNDLEKKLIRAVGDAQARFGEDALRMMRAIRFGAQLGFGIEIHTQEAISLQARLLDHVSWERKRDELLKTLASDFPADGILLMAATGLLKYVIPELLSLQGIKQGGHHIYDVWRHSIESLRSCPSTDPIVRLATLLHDLGKQRTVKYEGPRGVTFYGHEVVGARIAENIGRRLRLSNKDLDRLYILVRWHMFAYDSQMTDAAIRRFINRVKLENINDMMLLRVGDRKGGGSKATSWRLRELQQRIGEQLYEPMSIKDLKVNGNDVMEVLKIKPGPIVGQILNLLFEEVMEDTSKNDRDYQLKRMVALEKEVG
jgi:tRNA nucleotidyltransferase (CCA-adding enzyme)